MSLTNYQKVADEFNTAFGVQNNTTPQLNLYDSNPNLVAYRSSLINEEVDEFNEAVKNKDFKETIDALTDILYVVYGAFSAFGIDADKAFSIVHDSNMSKLCKTEEDAIETVNRYRNETPQRYDSPNYRKADDGVHWVVYNESTMKILKNYKYTTVDFSNLINQ
jgi:predicted HAD superfamily Cof-like phosphohydrolase